MANKTIDRATASSIVVGEVLARIELPSVTMTQLVLYCGAAGVSDPIHFDRDFAKRSGFPNCVVNGSLRVAWMSEAASSIVREPNYLAEIDCSHVKPMYVGTGAIIEICLRERVQNEGGDTLLRCDLEMKAAGDVVDRARITLQFV